MFYAGGMEINKLQECPSTVLLRIYQMKDDSVNCVVRVAGSRDLVVIQYGWMGRFLYLIRLLNDYPWIHGFFCIIYLKQSLV